MSDARLIHATESLRKALRKLHKANHPDVYIQLGVLENARDAATTAALEIDLEYRERLRALHDKLNHAWEGVTGHEPAQAPAINPAKVQGVREP